MSKTAFIVMICHTEMFLLQLGALVARQTLAAVQWMPLAVWVQVIVTTIMSVKTV